jgi:hypothetical protein
MAELSLAGALIGPVVAYFVIRSIRMSNAPEVPKESMSPERRAEIAKAAADKRWKRSD